MPDPVTAARDDTAGAYELFLLGLSVYVLSALAAETLLPLSPETRQVLGTADTAICLVFLFDFLRSLRRAERKLDYLKWGWIDLLSSIPMLDAARWGRAARLVRILRVLRGLRSVKAIAAHLLARRAEAALSAVALVSILLVIFASVAVLQFETGPEANIRTPGDALWWAFATVTTVGYGDKYPVGAEGRVVAALLTTAGIGLFGTLTGLIASWFLAPGQQDETAREDAQSRELVAIRAELALLRETLRERSERDAERDVQRDVERDAAATGPRQPA